MSWRRVVVSPRIEAMDNTSTSSATAVGVAGVAAAVIMAAAGLVSLLVKYLSRRKREIMKRIRNEEKAMDAASSSGDNEKAAKSGRRLVRLWRLYRRDGK